MNYRRRSDGKKKTKTSALSATVLGVKRACLIILKQIQ